MDAVMITSLGAIGTALSTLSLVPQVVHTWRTRSVADLSATWLVVALLSMLVWISYGSLVAAPAIVWANSLTFLQAGYLLTVKLQTSRKALAPNSPESGFGPGSQPLRPRGRC